MIPLMYCLGSMGAGLACAVIGGSVGSKYNLLVPGILAGLIFGLIVGIGKIEMIKRVHKKYNLGKLKNFTHQDKK
jgi:hypothetical protein